MRPEDQCATETRVSSTVLCTWLGEQISTILTKRKERGWLFEAVDVLIL